MPTLELCLGDGFNFDPGAKESVLDDKGVYLASSEADSATWSSDEEGQFVDSNAHSDDENAHIAPAVGRADRHIGLLLNLLIQGWPTNHILNMNLYPTFEKNPFAQEILERVLKETNFKEFQSKSKGPRRGHERKTELDLIDKQFPHGTRNGENVEILNWLHYAHVKRAIIVVCHHGTLDEKQNPLTLEDLNKIFSDPEIINVLDEMNSKNSEVDMQKITCFAMIVKFLHDRIGLKGNSNFGLYLSIAARLESPDPTVQYNTGKDETPPTRLRRRIIYLLTGIGKNNPRGLPVAKSSSGNRLK